MRNAHHTTALLLHLLLLPALGAAQATTSTTDKPPQARVMVVRPTQSVSFAGSLDQLRQRLQPRAEQWPMWQAYESSVEAYSRAFFAELPLASYAQEPAPRQVEWLAEQLQSRVLALREIERNARALYALLDPAQQRIADQHLLASVPVFGYPPPAR